MKRTIVVADDRPIGRELLVALFSNSGCRVVEASDGEEALRAVQAEDASLLVVDYSMPRMNGDGVIRRLRGGGWTTPVIVYTANASEASRTIDENERTRILSKPSDPETILRIAGEMLGRRSGHKHEFSPVGREEIRLATIVDAQIDLMEAATARDAAERLVRRAYDLFGATWTGIVCPAGTIFSFGMHAPMSGRPEPGEDGGRAVRGRVDSLTVPFATPRNRFGTLSVQRTHPFLDHEERALSTLALHGALVYENQLLLAEQRLTVDVIDTARRRAESTLDERTLHLGRARSDLAARTHAQQVLAELSSGALGAGDIGVVLDHAVSRISDVLAAETVRILQVTPEGTLAVRSSLPGAGGSEDLHSLALESIETGGVATAPDACAVPITFGRRKLGAIFVRRGAETFEEPEIDFLRSVAATVATIWSRKNREQLILAEAQTAQSLARARSLTEAAPALLAGLCETMGWHLAQLWRADGESETLVLEGTGHASTIRDVVAEQFAAASRHISFAPRSGLIGSVWSSGAPGWIDDVTDSGSFLRATVAAEADLRTGFGVPILGADAVLGVIEFFTGDIRPPDPDVVATVEAVARQIAHFLERRAAEDELARTEEQYRTLLEGLPTGVFELDAGGCIAYLNRDLARIAEVKQAGGRFADLFIEPERARVEEALDACIREGAPVELTARIASAGRGLMDLEVRGVRTRVRGRSVVIGSARDVSERLRLEEERARMRTAAALGALVAGVAHEVRNPLFNISSSAELLAALRPGDPEVVGTTEILITEVRRLTSMMRELLDYARPVPAVRAADTIESVIASAVENVSAAARASGVAIEVSSPSPLPLLEIDAAALRRVFINVLDNAIRFAPPSSSVTVSSSLSTPLAVECRVADRGPGFAEEDLGHVFDPFYSKREGGTGLGLALVQRIVNDHGGTIQAANRSGGGAEVTITIPLRPSAGEAEHRSAVAGA
jgi:PAS domain S-box-containing protein